jgi:parallel beta-helix repeat protein
VSATDGESLPSSFGKERKRSLRVAILAVVLVAVLTLGAVACLTVQNSNKKSEYTTHSPISITGNAGFTKANGVVGGKGTASDPYLIEGWDINATKVTGIAGIAITDTTAWFVVRSCSVHDGGILNSGIMLSNCTNGMLVNNIFSNNWGAVDIDMSSNNNEVSRNLFYNNGGAGVYILSSSGNHIWNNTFIGNNGANDTYNVSHAQAYYIGTDNWWNSTNGYGNYWSDWTKPDANHDGIVDQPYNIAGGAGAKDYYPLATPPVPIP